MTTVTNDSNHSNNTDGITVGIVTDDSNHGDNTSTYMNMYSEQFKRL